MTATPWRTVAPSDDEGDKESGPFGVKAIPEGDDTVVGVVVVGVVVVVTGEAVVGGAIVVLGGGAVVRLGGGALLANRSQLTSAMSPTTMLAAI